jgi:hypothetical protein
VKTTQRSAPTRVNLVVVASAIVLALTLDVAHAADTSAPGATTGATIGTPGAEHKGNPIPGPDNATENTGDPGNPAATTLAEESKRKPKIPE